jgi:hypothetical protein
MILNIKPTAIMVEPCAMPTEPQLRLMREMDHIPMNGTRNTIGSNILEHPDLQDIKLNLEAICNKYLQEVYGTTTDVYMKITTSIHAMSDPGMSQGVHLHHNALVAGCMYLTKSPKSPIKIICDGPYFKSFDFQFPYDKETPYNQGMVTLDCSVGDVVIFPGNLYHYVENDDHREVIGFSAFVYGDFSKATNTWARYNKTAETAGGYGSNLKIQ